MINLKKKDDLLDNLVNSISNVTKAESNIYDYCQELDAIQDKILDIEHYIENNEISRNGSINLIALLKELRMERRQIKQMWELWKVYGNNRDKIKAKDWREFLINELYKKDKELQTEYNYRQFDSSYLDKLNEDIPLKRGPKPKVMAYNNNEEEENNEE